MTELLNRTPPYNMEAEQAVLGSILIDAESLATAVEHLKSDDFYSESHKEIFAAILDIHAKSDPVDVVTLVEEIKNRGNLERAGGIAYLTDLSMSVPSTANVKYYIKIVDEKSTLRRLISASNEIIRNCYQGQEELENIIDQAEKRIFELSQRQHSHQFFSIKEVLLEVYARIEELAKNKGRITGVPTGFAEFDNITSGLNPSELILVAARPSMGKTSFVLNIAQYAALRARVPVALFSLEMAKEQLAQRMLSSEANVELHKIRVGKLDEADWLKLVKAAGPLSQAPIYIDDSPSINSMELRSKARRLKMERNIGMVIIDYLQLMSGKGRIENRQQEISEISRSLKALARELKVPVVALSQLSRAPEARAGHRPMLSDLRESGAIEQDADLVAFLYRDEYYNKDTDKKNIAEVIIAKQRNGPTGTVELVWLGQFTKFAGYDRVHSES